MGLFTSYQDFAINTIEENLHIAKHCIDTTKKPNTNSCYGMPAFTLLTSVIDTIGSFYSKANGTFKPILMDDVNNNKTGNAKDHFNAFYDKFIKNENNVINIYSTSNKQKFFHDKFYLDGRCKATHNNVLGSNFIITIEENCGNGACIWEEKDKNNNYITYVHLSKLHELVSKAFNKMKKEAGVSPQPEATQATTGSTSQTVVTYQIKF